MKKITLATVKKFIKENSGRLYIKTKTEFDGMVDCVMPCENKSFRMAVVDEDHPSNSLGIKGAWFVGSSRDYFSEFEADGFTGINVSNSCGSFILAIPLEVNKVQRIETVCGQTAV